MDTNYAKIRCRTASPFILARRGAVLHASQTAPDRLHRRGQISKVWLFREGLNEGRILMKKGTIRLGGAALAAALVVFFFFGRGASGVNLGSPAPELKGGPWLNSGPLQMKDLLGKVVLVKMWTFG